MVTSGTAFWFRGEAVAAKVKVVVDPAMGEKEALHKFHRVRLVAGTIAPHAASAAAPPNRHSLYCETGVSPPL